MAEKNYAFIKNNNVVNIVIFNEPTEELLQIFKLHHEVDLIVEANERTFIGGTFDGKNFWPASPFASWVRNEDTLEWNPPTLYPTDGKSYRWDEETTSWVEATPA